MIIVDETVPEGDLPSPFPCKDVIVKCNDDVNEYYNLKKEIGRGRFGTVYLCTCKKTGVNFAAKFVNTKRAKDRENVEREIEVMKVLNRDMPNPKLIQLYDAFDMGKQMCLVLEVVDGGELFERVIDDDFVLTERACAIFVRQICEGIMFIHSKNVLHLDMKPENILCLSREGNRVKICDFGLARCYDPRKKLQVLFGTPEFVAPEVVLFEPIGFSTDMWSVGVICYVLLSGLSPFLGANYVETMTNVTKKKYDFDDEAFDDISDEAKEFIEGLLVLEKSERLTPEQCIRHQWMKKALSGPSIQSQITATNDIDITQIACDDKAELLSEVVQVHMTVNSEKMECNVNSVNLDLKKKSEEILNICTTNNDKASTIVEIENDKQTDDTIVAQTTENIVSQTQEPLVSSDRKRKDRDSNDSELESAKKQLKDFVEDRKSVCNSPYIIASPEIDPSLSVVSYTSNNSELNYEKSPIVINNQTREFHTELENNKNTDVSSNNIMFNEHIAKALETKLNNIKNNEIDDINIIGESSILHQEKPSMLDNIFPKGERIRLKRQDAVHPNQKEQSPNPEKEPTQKFRPSRDVPMITNKKWTKDENVSINEHANSPSTHTPLKRSRRTSNEEYGSCVNVTQAHRRPSRDVPLVASQAIRHLSTMKQRDKPKANSQEIWPDVYYVPEDKGLDDTDYAVLPVTGKLEIPVVVLSASNKPELEQDKSFDSARKSSGIEKAKSLDDSESYSPGNKHIKWIIDVNSTKQMLSDLPKDTYTTEHTNFMQLPCYIENNSTTPNSNFIENFNLPSKHVTESVSNSQKCNTLNDMFDVSSKENHHNNISVINDQPSLINNDIELPNKFHSDNAKETSPKRSRKIEMLKESNNKTSDDEYKQKQYSCPITNDLKDDRGLTNIKASNCGEITKLPLNGLHKHAEESILAKHHTLNASQERQQIIRVNLIPKKECQQNHLNKELENILKNFTDSPVTNEICTDRNASVHSPTNELRLSKTNDMIKRTHNSVIDGHSTSKKTVNNINISETVRDSCESENFKTDVNDPLQANSKSAISNVNKKPNLPIPESSHKNLSSNSKRNGSEEFNRVKMNKSSSSSSLKTTDSNENVTVNTPWGPMRKSPSRNSSKSPDRNIVIINLADSKIESNKKKLPLKNFATEKSNTTDKTSDGKISKKDKVNIKMNGFNADNIPINKMETTNNEVITDSKQSKIIDKGIPNNINCNNTLEKLNSKDTIITIPSHSRTTITSLSKGSDKSQNNVNNKSNLKHNINEKLFNVSKRETKPSSKITRESSGKDENARRAAIKIDISYEELFGSSKDSTSKIEKLPEQNGVCKTDENNRKQNAHKDILNIKENKLDKNNDAGIKNMVNSIPIKWDPNNNGMENKHSKHEILVSTDCNKLGKGVHIEQIDNRTKEKQSYKENRKQNPTLNLGIIKITDQDGLTIKSSLISNNKNDKLNISDDKYKTSKTEIKCESPHPKTNCFEHKAEIKDIQSKNSLPQKFPHGLKNSMSMKASMDKFYDSHSHKRKDTKEESACSRLTLKIPESGHPAEPRQLGKLNKLLSESDKSRDSKESSKRNSLSDSDREESTLMGVTRRKNKPTTITNGTASFRMSLFSAQDRISLFEKKQETDPKRTGVPLSRSKTSAFIGDKSPKIDILSKFNRNSIYEHSTASILPSIYTHA